VEFDTKTVWKYAKYVMPMGTVIDSAIDAAAWVLNKTNGNGSVNDQEVLQAELKMRMAAAHAKVTQELAIARRISEATEVSIEEHYAYSGAAHIGIKLEKEAGTIGAGAEGMHVSKRVYKFSGFLTPTDAELADVSIEIAEVDNGKG
jgi:hypothetical protein